MDRLVERTFAPLLAAQRTQARNVEEIAAATRELQPQQQRAAADLTMVAQTLHEQQLVMAGELQAQMALMQSTIQIMLGCTMAPEPATEMAED